jgi:lipoate-protein ligase B
MPNPLFHSEYLGRISYDAGLIAQEEALKRLESGEKTAIVMGLEHDPVITLGIRGKKEIDLVESEQRIMMRGFAIRQTQRGGQATLHVPGQLVIYPICNLRILEFGARDYVCAVEKATGSWLTSLGVRWQRSEAEPGIFVGSQKLVAFGFRIAHGKSSHGLAINVTNSPADFNLIRTCGVGGQLATNLAAQGVQLDLPELFASWVAQFYLTLDDPACRGLA